MGATAVGEEGEVRVGSIVWVRTKNGIWWPGTVMSDHHHFPFTASRAKIKLLGRDNASVDWYNLESSKRIKAFRCGEFDECIRKAESTKAMASTKNLKYARLEDAILRALELERQVVQKKLKRPGSDMQQESCSRAKRSKRVYFSLESRDCMEQSSKGSPNPFHASAKSTPEPVKSDSSESENEVQMTSSKAPSDIYVKRHKNVYRKSRGGIRYSSESSVDDKTAGSATLKKCKTKRKLSIQQVCRRPVARDDDRSCVLDYKGAVPAPRQIFGDSYLREKNECHFGSAFSRDAKETLIDVEIEVLASYREVHVPLVSMMSRLNGKAIVGHPVNIEVLEGVGEAQVLKKNLGEELLHSHLSRTCQLVWKTSKRTPVSYSPLLPSTCEDKKITRACEGFGGLTCSAKISDLSKTAVPVKSLKKQQISNRSRKVFHTNRLRSVGNPDNLQSGMNDGGAFKGEAMLPPVACVPVKDIFGKLLAAVSKA